LHVDILNTSAWNVVIWGRKEWIFCPPTSDARLLVNEPDLFNPAEQHRLSRRGLDIRLCSQKPGDLLFVPHGWWHQVRNAEPTLAVTANIVNHVNCSDVQRAVQEAQLPALQAVGGALSKAIAMHLIDIK
jgi:oxalate decarboxylase/phosphoglucose isomerase-like protein (cupin superfamily)